MKVILLHRDQSELIGFLIYSHNFEGEYEILDVGISPQYRKNGNALEIFEYFFEEIAQGEKENEISIFLEVAENNLPAIKLYQKLGFEEYNIRKNYYKFADGLYNALLFRKII